ncbi:bone morphogenetic protein 2-like [Megalops cyprinoides]|uniref:bone morphogenetic protein 2-like n=1 Tax=Megalops cyprinoides TaxID=118141 RepID=UPI0018646703|nr:bone morphogenetic protein 2-like [Megalops cyprinoides]
MQTSYHLITLASDPSSKDTPVSGDEKGDSEPVPGRGCDKAMPHSSPHPSVSARWRSAHRSRGILRARPRDQAPGFLPKSLLARSPRSSPARVSSQFLSVETERKDAREVVSQAIKRLHEVFHIGDLPQNLFHHRAPPQFMLDLFNAVADSHGVTRDPKILEGNVVRSFEDRGHSDRIFHFFNLSSFDKSEKLIKAEFRLFRQKQNVLSRNSYGHHFYRLDLYERLDSRVAPWRGNLITSRLLPLYTQGWEVFNVTNIVSKWIHRTDANNGILAVTTMPSGNIVDSDVAGLERNSKKKAYLVIFSDDGREESKRGHSLNQGNSLIYRNAIYSAASLKKVYKSRRTRAAPSYSDGHPISCQRLPLYVDFERIGWSGWIISPRGYNAYHCSGSCPFPLGESLRATNHATVQSIVNALKLSREVETPCCVPDKLQSISLLYFDDEENVVLKQYDDMVALSCGCH